MLAQARDVGRWRRAGGLGQTLRTQRSKLETPLLSLMSESPTAPGSASRNLELISSATGSVSTPTADICASDLFHFQSVLYSATEVSQIDPNMPLSEGAILSLSHGPHPSPQNTDFL